MVTLARKKPDSPSIESVLRSIPFISPEDSVADRLRTFIEQHIHIAAVKDEKGQILGLVTLEDLLEEVVGEVEDEFDRLPRDIQQVPPAPGSPGAVSLSLKWLQSWKSVSPIRKATSAAGLAPS